MIVFKKLTFANFLSVGNQPVSIDLDGTKTTLVHGSNGSGKSTILDALTYVLFNKPFRRVNLPQLINTQNKKGLCVEVEFQIGNNSYLVRRGMKPRVFDVFKNKEILDSKAADRDNQNYLEQSILKLSYKSFTQVVILGSSNFTPFMQLKPLERRECVEDFLDIQVFSTMATMAKERLRGLKEQLNEHRRKMEVHEIEMRYQQQKLNDMEKRSAQDIDDARVKIGGHQTSIDNYNMTIAGSHSTQNKIQEQIDELLKGDPDGKKREFMTIHNKLCGKIERLSKENEFFETNDTCPTCSQKIEDHFVDDITMANETTSAEYAEATADIQERVKQLNSTLDAVRKLTDNRREIENSIFEQQIEMKAFRNAITELEDKITQLECDTQSSDREQGILLNMQKQHQLMDREQDSIQCRVNNHEVVVNLLRDSGIKAQIVKKYLPVMNQFVRKYLGELDLPVHFVLDEEFNESVSSPLHQDFSYGSFSEGQKGRIDLALMFTWREIGKLKNSVTTNLLILDEVFSSSLDDVGKENLLRILRFKLPDNQRVVVVDHTLSDSFKEKFDRNVEVSLQGGFSRYN